LCCNPHLAGGCRDAGQEIPAAQGRGLRQQSFQIAEDMTLPA
jgi:hypothetical protein